MKALISKRLTGIVLLISLAFAAKSQVNLTASGGTSTGSFTTLNAAFAAINAGTHMGSIVITIDSNTIEPSTPTPLNGSGIGSASYTKILINVSGNDTIHSASSPSSYRGIIEFKGASNVTIDGDDPLTAGTQNLTIMSATSTSYAVSCIRLCSSNTSGTGGSTYDTIKNCVVIGPRSSASSTTTNYCIRYSDMSSSNTSTSGAYGNVNNAFINNTILRATYGIYIYGQYSYPAQGTLIERDTIGNSTVANSVWYGLYLYYVNSSSTGDGAMVRGNDIQGGGGNGYGTYIYGIYLGYYNYNTVITGNNIHDISNPNSSTYAGAHGIFISTNSSVNARIENNFIRDINR